MTTVKRLMNLKGRLALVTGAGGAIGKVIAESLAELGADLILVDHPNTDYGQLPETLTNSYGVRVWPLYCDLESETERIELLKATRSLNGGLNVLINNAAFVGTSGLGGWVTTFEKQSIDTWRRALEVNLTAAFDLAKQFTPLLRERTGASIINIGSIYGLLGPDYSLYEGTAMGNPAAYAASKGGLIQLTRWLATTLAPDIRVNCISPGGLFRNQPKSFVDRYEARTPLGRMATEDDMRGAVAYLASDLSSYVTGHNLVVDGGWNTW